MVIVSLLVMPTLGWRWLLAFATLPVVIFIILCKVLLNTTCLCDSPLTLLKEDWVSEYKVQERSDNNP